MRRTAHLAPVPTQSLPTHSATLATSYSQDARPAHQVSVLSVTRAQLKSTQLFAVLPAQIPNASPVAMLTLPFASAALETMRFSTALVEILVGMADLKEASSATTGILIRGTDAVPHALWRITTPVLPSLPFWGMTTPPSAAISALQT